MKVLLINGSRRNEFCTNKALSIIANELNKENIETEIFFIGDKIYNGQIDETVKEVAALVKDIDGFVVGSPVYYASPSGEVISFLDRLFSVAGADLTFKPACAVTSARRGGTTATIDVLNKYFMFNQMPIVSSNYWNMVHGNTPDEVLEDKEGIQIMENLGKNMAWLIKCINMGAQNGINHPEVTAKIKTNFTR